MCVRGYVLSNNMISDNFIDNDGGLYIGNEEEFKEWSRNINLLIGSFGLSMDESNQ